METEHFIIEAEHFKIEAGNVEIETEHFKMKAAHLKIEALRLNLKPCVSMVSPASQFEDLRLNLYVSPSVIPRSKSPFHPRLGVGPQN